MSRELLQRDALTQGALMAALRYDPETGDFHWRNPVYASWKSPAGSVANGRKTIWVNGFNYYASRLAWLYVYGVWPNAEIDHINGNSTDNRIANLRDVSHAVNMQNQKRPRKDNRSGLIGAQKNGSGWRAVVKTGGKKLHLGTYDTPEQAHAAYLQAKKAMHPAFGATHE